MKFHDLAIGQRFELEGAVYAKTSPVLASREDGGERKFLARYVVVKPLDGAARPPAEKADKLLRAEAVIAAFEAFHARCRDELAQLSGDIPADKLDALTQALAEGRKVFLDALSQQ
ncbi:MAG: hypothetical protein Q7U25_06400 [Sulfuricella sp.]|jgi:hypothetical protein|nr:hypothetical protein [Sulfuricella sp.]